MESEKPTAGLPAPLADESRTTNLDAQPPARERSREWSDEKRARQSRLLKAHWVKKRRQRNKVKSRVAQQKRQKSLEAEQPEEPQQPTSEKGAPGTGLARREQYNLLPIDVQQDLEAFRSQVIADLGGESELSAIKAQYVRRLAQIDTIINLVFLDLNTRGMLTTKGKVRSTVEAFWKGLDRYDKLAQRLGLDRSQKNIGAIEQWVRDKQAREGAIDATTVPEDTDAAEETDD